MAPKVGRGVLVERDAVGELVVTEVNYTKALLLAAALVCVTVLAALKVLDGAYVASVFTLVVGYVVGNGVGAAGQARPSAPLVERRRAHRRAGDPPGQVTDLPAR